MVDNGEQHHSCHTVMGVMSQHGQETLKIKMMSVCYQQRSMDSTVGCDPCSRLPPSAKNKKMTGTPPRGPMYKHLLRNSANRCSTDPTVQRESRANLKMSLPV